jgi:hypothetical protein
MSTAPNKQNLIVSALTLFALALVIAAYFSPIWWVSLTAPNYPKDAFPDGIRIHFHFDGVYNGCKAAAKGSRLSNEILEKDIDHTAERYNPITDAKKDVNKGAQGLDCVHEMNTINHYVGMYPIDSGGPVERHLAKFFFGMFAAMLLAFIMPKRRQRVVVLAAGLAVVSAWTLVDQYGMGQLAQNMAHLGRELGTYFKEPAVIAEKVSFYTTLAHAGAIGIVLVSAALVLGVAKIRAFTLLLPLVPALLPVFFVIFYAGWLWHFGHHLHPMGAFTLKPFMPTVFGEGKVAQFSTFSYPYYGYGMLVVASLALLLALLIRRKQMKEGVVE